MSEPRIRVGALLRHGDAVLLLRQEKAGRSYWLLPGGGVEEGESLHVALARELSEECGLEGLTLDGPIAIVESIAPAGLRPRKHVVHVIFHADVSGRSLEDVASADGAVHGHRLVHAGELAAVDLRPPIHRFLERWRPGDPFVHLGELWGR
ncbi:MAG TPA: NUDIX hydrolase [Gaiellales bacterium]